MVPTLRKRLEGGPANIKVNETELARFLFVMMEDETIKNEGLEDVLHTLQDPGGRKPRLTDQEMIGGDDFRTGPKTKLNPPKCKPTEVQIKRMVAIGLSLIVEKVMSNFLYTFGGEDRRQASGGPIGDVLTQAIARHMGNEFDEKFTQKMDSLNIKRELYQRYADDIDLVVRSVGRERKFCPVAGNFVEKTSPEVQEESSQEEDEITMVELKKIADNIIKHVETEHDYPSNHPELGYKVPVLDLAVWVEEVRVAAPGLEVQQLHGFCTEDEICLPVGVLQPRPPVQPSIFPSYTPPVNRGFVAGRSIPNTTSDFRLIQPPGSQDLVAQSDAQSAPHPTPGSCGTGCLCPSRPCRCNIEQSQLAHLAPRTSQPRDQDVGLLPPVTILDQSRGHPSNIGHSGGRPSQHYAHPAERVLASGGSIPYRSSDTQLIQPPGNQLLPRNVQQVRFEFFSKPMAAKKVMLASSAQSWGQKRTSLTQELIRRLLNCSKELPCLRRRKHLNNFMQLLKNSGYNQKFRSEILKSGLNGYNKILKAERDGVRPTYRPKGWNETARWLVKRRKKNNWLGPFWKSCIFVPPTPGSELKKLMQSKEEEMRTGGRETYPIKIIETAGKTLERALVNTDPFDGNKCGDVKCIPSQNPKNKINCRRNGVCYRISCRSCLMAGRPADATAYLKSATYYGESAKNMHCRSKEHESKFNSKNAKTRSESAFHKHLVTAHGDRDPEKNFSDYYEVDILKAYKKPFTRLVEEGTFISSHRGELLNSKSEWHQAKVIRTTVRVAQGGAEILQPAGRGVGDQPPGRRTSARTGGQ